MSRNGRDMLWLLIIGGIYMATIATWMWTEVQR